MNSRPTQPTSSIYRQEDDRRRDEARVVTLQNQVDELRQAMREVLSRQLRGEEQLKLYEGAAAQNRLTLEQIRQEAHQTAQARALDENRTRQQLADLEAHFEDATRPIRSLQAHVTELLEVSRKKTDDTGVHERRYDELGTAIEHLAAQNDRTAVVTHQLRDAIDLLRSESDQLRRDLLRAEDAAKIIDQEARRRIAEVAQVGASFGGRIDELRADLAHLYDLLDETRRGLVHIDPTLEELRAADELIRVDVVRNQAQAIERHEVLVDRAEDVRVHVDARFDDVRQTIETRAERLADRIEALGDEHRELGFRVGSLAGELEGLRQVDAGIRRDVWYLHEQRVRLRFEQIQQELDIVTGQRRDAETSAGDRNPAGTAALDGRSRRRVAAAPDGRDVDL
ncbi:MAG: hypothetical protein AVDCRST_MAG49-3908 [uncultured Thermomicrobiales bacterium]|uniref:Chromosome partition protein smc n=1 Tax=uncultured Thermomicrobiales bacterium TaxID=1645740 RepID=A0A6J4VAS0_9BACT|nr:MAG: hypothetical protein AVDCRST_MAG49-3908 [uncultured Thermomicrobiales bacterium]